MKTLICLLGIGLMVSQNIYSKKLTEKELPSVVRDSFVYTFPLYSNGSAKVDWYTVNYEQYYAKFRMDGQFATAVFNKDGHCIETSVLISTKLVPSNIIDTVRNLYPAYYIIRAEDVLSYSNSKFYRLEISNGKREILVVLNYACGIVAENNELLHLQ